MIYKKLSTYVFCAAVVVCCISNNVYSSENSVVEALKKKLAENAASYRKDIADIEGKNKFLVAKNAKLAQQVKEVNGEQQKLEAWRHNLDRREYDVFLQENACGLGRLESDLDALAQIDKLCEDNAILVKENKRLSGHNGPLTTAARYFENGDYKQAVAAVYDAIFTKAKNAYTTVVDFVSENPYKIGAAVAGVTWLSMVYAMRSSYALLTRPHGIASCMAELPVAQLESLDQGGVTEMLIDYIYTMYRTSHDEYKAGSAYAAESRFYKDLLAELHAAECYMWWASVLPHWTLRKLFLFNEALYNELPTRIERLHYYKRLFLRWVDARNDAATQSAGPGFGGGLSGLLG